MRGLRWRRLDDLAASAEGCAPRDLPELARDLLEGGPPVRPVRVVV